MKLKNLKPGQSAKIKKIDTIDRSFRTKLIALGLVPGAMLTVLRTAPLGDPVEIKVRGAHLSLRKHEADILLLELIHHA